MPYAHSQNDRGERHELVAHLRGVARLTAEFAQSVDARELGSYLGLWHDLGKFRRDFQAYLLACESAQPAPRRGPDHKAAGAQMTTAQRLGLLALLIQGHHGGLQPANQLQGWLDERVADPAVDQALAAAQQALPDLEPAAPLSLPAHLTDPRTAELFLRLLFSALVDADSLDTEQHFAAERAAIRTPSASLAALWERFERNQQQFLPPAQDAVSQARHAMYEACLAAAERPPGLFRLTVPTGGGKTRSAMAFALRHAMRYGQQRVIVAVPFISITEQTAETYQHIFGAAAEGQPVVLEHHSATTEASDDAEDYDPQQVWTRLAAENWDAPIIVTTTVQLFESLFASSPSRCRKAHRLARSVIILDEAQALPPHLLQPILDALHQLTAHYGTTVVLSTATQPAFEAIPAYRDLAAHEIVPEPERFFARLRRVTYDWRLDPTLSWPEVAALLADSSQALAVVNTKKDALALLDALDDPDALHLSTLLCGAHRRHVIEKVKHRLAGGEPCRLVSTQVIEAGVDLDFPLVLRALGPLDSIIQAAGRCNREGRLPQPGRVIVFKPADGGLPTGSYGTATQLARAVFGTGNLDLDDPALARSYFQQLFHTVETDAQGIQALRSDFDYPEVARRFRMIDEATESVAITCYGNKDERQTVQETLERLRAGDPQARHLRRRLQPYLVTIYARPAAQYRQRGLITVVVPGLGEWHGKYDPVRGLAAEGPDAERLVLGP